jgi:hypothetical protein
MATPIEPMEAVKVLRDALARIFEGSWTQGAHTGMSWQQAGQICADALNATTNVEAPTSGLVPLSKDGSMVFIEGAGAFRIDYEEAPSSELVLFYKRGGKMVFSIGAQSFALDYEPDTDEEFNYMGAMLTKAISRAAPQALPATEQAKPLTLNAVDYIMAAVECYADELGQYLTGTTHRAETHKRALITKARIRRMLEDSAPPNVSPAKPDLSGLNRETIIEVLLQYQMAHSVEVIAAALLATQPVAQAKPDAPQIPLKALYQFAAGYCMDKSALVSVAESARYWFNKCLADPSVMDAFPVPDMAKPDASEREAALSEAEAACRTIMESYDNEHNRSMGVAQEMMECAGDCIDAINELKSVAATTSKPDAEGGGA